jgi:hypothetical protein
MADLNGYLSQGGVGDTAYHSTPVHKTLGGYIASLTAPRPFLKIGSDGRLVETAQSEIIDGTGELVTIG